MNPMKNLIRIAALMALLAAGFGNAALAQAIAASGAGYHDPRSPIKPLQERSGVLAWSLLSAVQNKVEKNKLTPIFPAQVQVLDKKKVRVQGFMMPLEPGDKQQHFLLSAVPTSCAFCVPAGPEGLIEVRSKQPVRYSLEPIVMEGQLAVLSDDPYGMFYRLSDGQEVKP
jgi:hypothetical protein